MAKDINRLIVVVLIGCTLWIIQGIMAVPDEEREYCEEETFVAECGASEVVVMDVAQYGRMSLGGCLSNKYGLADCSSDVRDFFDGACSGRVRCEVKVHSLVEHVTPCDKDLRSHLIATYNCLQVFQPTKPCYPNDKPVISGSTSGYLSSYVTGKTGCGTVDSPWIIRGTKGQRINLTLIDFSPKKSPLLSQDNSCQVLVSIKEVSEPGFSRAGDTVCRGLHRERHIYTSVGDEVEIRFMSRPRAEQNTEEDQTHFIIKYEVSGCEDIPISSGTELVYTQDGAVIKCSGKTFWQIKCVNNMWQGEWHNCTQGEPVLKESLGAVMSSVMTLPYGTSIILVISIALAIGSCVLLMGLCYVKRKRRLRMETTSSLTHQGILQKNMPPPPYTDVTTNYTVPDSLNNPYQHSQWAQQQQQLHHHQQQHPHTVRNPQFSNLNSSGRTMHNAHMGVGGNPDDYQQRYVDHIYESPKFDRKDYESQSAPQSLQYYEVQAGGGTGKKCEVA